MYAYAEPKYFCDRVEETECLISALRNEGMWRFSGHTSYIQYVLNRLYEQREDVLNEVLFEKCWRISFVPRA